MMVIDQKLKEREAAGKPIQVALFGAGGMGVGLVNQIERHTAGMRVAGIFNRTLSRAREAYSLAGNGAATVVSTANDVDDAIRAGKAVVADNPEALLDAGGIDVVVEMTGEIGFSFDLILKAFAAGKHVVSFNAEVDATVGPYFQRMARNSGVRYTLGDGDQPGVTLNLYRQVKAMGLVPLVCGNIKGMLDHYRTPETQRSFAEKTGMSVKMVTNFADGTKVSLEQASTANATGMCVAKRGMLAFESDRHVDELTGLYDFEQLKELGGIVDMIIGARPGPGIFVYATTDDPVTQRLLSYGKLGDGPLYSFYVPYHLLFLEFAFSIVRLVDYGDGTVDAGTSLQVEVITTAKRDLKAGETLDGIGGFTVYGECENQSVVSTENLLPIGFSEGKKLLRDVPKDGAISWADVLPEPESPAEKAYRSLGVRQADL